MTYCIKDLRDDLAGTIRALRDGDEKMNVEKARAIGELAGKMIDSAKVEVDMLRVIGRGQMKPTGFLAIEHEEAPQPQGGQLQLPAPADTGAPKPKQHIRSAVGAAPRGSIR